ncbi:Serine/threonine-protein kinase ATM, partial [Mucuna pruriens]
MGIGESDNMVRVSSPMPESDSMVQGSEQEKEVSEVVGGLRSGEGGCGVPENGDGFSSIENQGLGDDGVVEVVKSGNGSVLETNVSVPSENACQVLADSEMDGVSSWLKMQESVIGTVFSSDGSEKLECDFASEKLDYVYASDGRVAEGAILSVDSFFGIGGEERRNEGESIEEVKDEDCGGNVANIGPENRVAEAATLSVDDLVGLGGEEERKTQDCEGNTVTVTFQSSVAEATILSVDGSIGFGGEGGGDGRKGEEKEKDEDCDGKILTIATSESRVVEAAVSSVDSLVGGKDGQDGGEKEGAKTDEDCDCNIATNTSENRVDEAAVVSVEGTGGEGGGEVEVCDGNLVTVEVPISETIKKVDVEPEDMNEGYGVAVGDFVWGRIESHPWWPGRVYDPSDASHMALKVKQKNRLLVAYFGDGTFGWCHPSQLKPFEENFDDMIKQSGSIAFVNAVKEAANEVGRVLYTKMSHPFANRTGSESTLPLVKNSGIKEGVLVPENGIQKFLDVPIEPTKLLSHVKQVAQIIDFASILEVEILKAELSAFYQSKGGYKLPNYMDPQPVPGVEDSLMDETVAVGSNKSTVEAPVQGPFEEDCYTLPGSPKYDEVGHSEGISGNISNHRRKQKSIAEIMGEDRDVHTENRVGGAADEMVKAIGSNGGKKRKGSENGMASKPVQKKKELLLDTVEDVSSADNDGKENSNIGTLMQSKEKKEAFGNEIDEGKSEERNGKGYLSRERKKSKYLSPPFTTSGRGKREENIEIESLKVSRKAKVTQRRAGAADPQSLPVYKGRFFDSSNYQTQEEDGKKTVDPKKIQVPVEEVLSQIQSAAISPQIPKEGISLDQFVNFAYVFRSSVYSEGSLREVFDEKQAGRKRKEPESEHGMLEDPNQSSPKQNSEPKRRRKETDPGALLIVSFWAGSTMPSTSDLISVYSKFGALNEAETNMFRANYTAKVSFLRTCDAENALHHSENNNPFGSDVTFRLQYLSDGSKSSQQVRSKRKPLPAAATASVSASQGSEASKLLFIKHKLQGITSMLEESGDKSPDMMAKLESEMKALLEDVNKMIEASLSIGNLSSILVSNKISVINRVRWSLICLAFDRNDRAFSMLPAKFTHSANKNPAEHGQDLGYPQPEDQALLVSLHDILLLWDHPALSMLDRAPINISTFRLWRRVL